MPKSFMTMHVTDPFTTAIEGVSEYPNAKRNILDDLNNAEATMLPPPPPPQKENLAVFLRYTYLVYNLIKIFVTILTIARKFDFFF